MSENKVINLDKTEHMTNGDILKSCEHLKQFIVLGLNEEGDMEVASCDMEIQMQLLCLELHKQTLLDELRYGDS